MGSFWGGGQYFAYELQENGSWWQVATGLYRGGRWEESSAEIKLQGDPPWPFEAFREATKMKTPPDGCDATTREGIPGKIVFSWEDANGVYHSVEWISKEIRANRKKFARDQIEILRGLGYSEEHASRIMRAGGPGVAVEATKWVMEWIGKDADYDDREVVLTVIWGLLRAPFQAPAHRMCAVLEMTGAPPEYPGTFHRLRKFLKAAEKAALWYFHREMPQEEAA